MTTILIVDDHPALRLALRANVCDLMEVTQVYEADNGQAAIDHVRQHKPDLVILDLDIPRPNGIEAVPQMRSLHPSIRVLILSAQDPLQCAARAFQAGAHGYVSKTQDLDAITRCAESVLAGFTVFPSLAQRDPTNMGRTPGLHNLSDKEMEILRMLARGMSNKVIGKALFISNKTVSSYKARIMGKLGAESVVDLADFARRHRLVP
ncbi:MULTISPECIES: response regulator transcription factor [unclassified Cupriavidus]|uniref:response regulator transcription factor n=1 Tax=unclassified Cupriavidus TaxID=2640874 RepID=UPI0028BBDD29|nr:response regulator transcription factor [Cupriavidus sp. SZY C1]MDT6963764.1 response regulator transcription factor [Cupriavidus sp. SZY C1]